MAGRDPTEQLVSPEPEVTVFARDHEKDEFLVLACDGIWDVMTNEDVSDFVRHQLRIHSNLETVCSSIIDTCLHKVLDCSTAFLFLILGHFIASHFITARMSGMR